MFKLNHSNIEETALICTMGYNSLEVNGFTIKEEGLA
jgi:hypothetical protein